MSQDLEVESLVSVHFRYLATITVSAWWLSLPTPLKDMKVSWDDYSQYMET